jgi:HlyD family secretion protein
VSGRIVELNVAEGDEVRSGQVLLRIDPTQFQAAAARDRATLSQAQATATERRASLAQAERNYERLRMIRDRDSTLISLQQLQDVETSAEVARALYEAAEHGVAQAGASLAVSEDRLEKTTIRAPISGRVTRLNVELGETVIFSTMTPMLLLTISDLSVIEAVMEVDETDVPEISVGDSALIELDAFPNELFRGRVTEIGNSAIRDPSTVAGTGQTPTIDFEVVITLDDPPEGIRPDLSTTADIILETRDEVLAIPIIALTIKEGADRETAAEEEADEQDVGPVSRAQREGDVEGVFVVREGRVTFTPVQVGVTGQEHFEVLSGLSQGDTVVSGPYQRIRQLKDGDPVRPEQESARSEASS